jgi:hypothetical protein
MSSDNNDVSIIRWLFRPSMWSRTQILLMAGFACMLAGIMLAALNGWRQNGLADVACGLGCLLVGAGYAVCVYGRSRH